jgi:tetratricopeptide (TPR) repeat protein
MGGRVSSPTFVGRVEELGVLEAARVRAASSEPAVVLLGGEAGVGKTRLVVELAAGCAADATRVLWGGCVPVAEGALPYAPIVEVVRALLAELGVEPVRRLVGPSWPELGRLLPALGEPHATGPLDQAAQARLFELLLGLVGRLGGLTPLVLVVEDLHWADRSTRDLLAFLVRNLRRERVLLVVTYRSDETGRARLGPYLAELDRAGPVQRLELPRFERAETQAQLTGILGAAPAPDLVDAVFARSEGNPFSEELLRAVRPGSGALPETLRDLLQGRVEVLPEPARHVLRVAAVAGRRVPHRLLADVAGLSDQEQTEALRTARVPRAAELAPCDRVTLLEWAAEATHLVGDVPRAADLLRGALDHVDPGAEPVRAGLLHERLGRYLWMSADLAALSAYEEAVRLVPAEPPSAERARVLAGYAELLGVRRATAESRQVAEEALATARRVGARREEGRALGSLADALAEAGDVDGALAQLRDARRIAEEQADVDGVGWASLQLAVLMERPAGSSWWRRAGRTGRSARSCSSPPRQPVSMSRGSWPSWESPGVARRPRSPTGSGSGSEWMERSLAWAVPTWRTTSACSATPTRVAVATECRSWWPTGTPTSATCSATA